MSNGLMDQQIDVDAAAHVAPAGQVLPDKMLENPKVQVQFALTLKHIAYILGGLALAAMAMVFLLYLVRGEIPDTIVLLASTVVTGCISGLVGYVAGQKNQNG